jgi:hypothetical protein
VSENALSKVSVEDRGLGDRNKDLPSGLDKHILISGSFYLFCLMSLVSFFGFLTSRLSLSVLLAIIVSFLLCIYLLALVLLPKPDVSIKGFVQLMAQFMKIVFRSSPKDS